MVNPYVSVIVLNWNGLQHLRVVLTSLEQQTYPRDHYEILFADNGSTDDSVAFVRSHFPQVKIVTFDKNYGFAEGNNKAAHLASGEALALINNDTEADRDWLRYLVEEYIKKPYALFGSQAYQFDRRNVSANSLMKLTAWGVPTNVNVFLPREKIPLDTVYTFYADAAGMLINKQLFFSLGGFDQAYFAYEEEKDLSWKAWLFGHPCYLVPRSIYYHKSGATLGQNSTKALYLLWRNGLQNIIKYPHASAALRYLFVHLGYSIGTFIKIFVPMHRMKNGWSMLSAYVYVFKRLSSLLKQRKIIQSKRVISDRHLASLGLVLNFRESLIFVRDFLGRR